LVALDFEERFAVIRQRRPKEPAIFCAEAALGRDELIPFRRRAVDSEGERGQRGAPARQAA
jgi:hypothetical protein